MPYYVYIVMCSDGTLYVGTTTDVSRRLDEHNHSDKGARYTRSRRPVVLKYREQLASRSAALTREAEIKKWSRARKLAFLQTARPHIQ
jgi:putative endonuclease